MWKILSFKNFSIVKK